MRKTLASLRRRWIGLLTVAAMIVAWEVAARLAPVTPLAQTPLVPSWANIFGPSLLGMADYWKFSFWAPITSMGGEQTLHGALLALGYHTGLTWMRLLCGVAIGAVVGIGGGLLMSWSSLLRRAAYMPVTMLRMVPLLAMIPLFQFWVGTNTAGVIAFVAYGTAVVYLVGTFNAVANVAPRYVEYAATLGASRLRIYGTIILPAIMPELSSSILLTLGLSWSAVIAAEYVGIDTGLGRIMTFAQFMSQTGRMALVTILLIAYASISYAVFRRIAARALAWMPGRPT
jgi:sulfonate transport system permease protein